MTQNIFTLNQSSPDLILGKRYKTLTILFFIIASLYSLWTLIVIFGVYSWNMGYRWAGLTIEEYMYGGIFLYVVLLTVEFIMYAHYYSERKKITITEYQPFQEYYKGKQLFTCTFPEGIKGGIFSKTYIQIDDTSLVNIRIQIIPPDALWGKKE